MDLSAHYLFIPFEVLLFPLPRLEGTKEERQEGVWTEGGGGRGRARKCEAVQENGHGEGERRGRMSDD